MSVNRHLRRVVASFVRSIGRPAALAPVCALGVLFGLVSPGPALAQTEQDYRCMQLQQELAAARGGGGNAAELANLDQQIAQQDRIFQGTQAAMDDSGCYERLLIFGRALKRNPKCLNMNARVEDARRQLARLQEQRSSLQRGGGNKRRQAELQQALRHNGCTGAPQSGGGLFDFFGGGREREEFQTPIYRSINPNGRYQSVCVRLCDGYYYPVSYSTYGSQLARDADQCQSSCAAPAELYVYRNPGQEIEQAISLSGSAYMDLPVALRYRKEFVQGCSCKQTEYNPTEIESASKKAEAAPAATGTQASAAGAPPIQAIAPEQPVPADMLQLDLDFTGATGQAEPAPAAGEVETEVTPPPAPPPAAAEAPAPPPEEKQSTIIKQPRAAAN